MNKLRIETLLDEIGIPLYLKGYKYLIDVIEILDRNPFIPITIVYLQVSENYGLSSMSIERTIRYITKNFQEKIKKFFNLNCKVDNKTLIFAIKRELERRKKDDLRK